MVSTDDLHQIRYEEQDLSAGDLELTPDTGESIEILARGIDSGGDEDLIEERIDEVAMLNYQSDEGDDEIFPRDHIDNFGFDLLAKLRMMGVDLPTLKVPSGKTYALTNPDSVGNATVIYRDLNREAYNASDPGGPESTVRTFISCGQVTDSIAADSTEDHPIDTSVNIGGIRDWPYEGAVPSSREYDVVGLMVQADGSTGGNTTLDNVRLRANEQDFLENSGSFVRAAGFAYPDDTMDSLGFIFIDPADGSVNPVTFSTDDDLTIRYEATNANTMAAENAIINATVIARERRM